MLFYAKNPKSISGGLILTNLKLSVLYLSMPDESKTNRNVSDIVRLCFRDGNGSLKPLPTWVKFFMDLGCFAVRPIDQSNEKRVIGLVLPTRSFASVFSSVGAVIGGLGVIEEQITDEDYFEYLCSLASGTAVKQRDNNKKGKQRLYDGIIVGTQEICGQVMLKIQREKSSMKDSAASGLTCYVAKDRARTISIPAKEDGISSKNLTTNQKGVRLAPSSGLANSILGHNLITHFERESSMTCIIVGTTTVLDLELNEPLFLMDAEIEGTLSELLRIKRLLPPGSPFRSNTFATNSRRPPRYNHDLIPDLVIFDGALGFLKWRNNFPSSHWLVLLDSTSHSFESGRDELNSRYLQRSKTEPELDFLPVLPDGIEMIFFQENR